MLCHVVLPSTRRAEQTMGMPASTKSPKRWTADEARALTAANPLLTPRYEVIDGELLETPSPTRYHQAAASGSS
jgi:Uma2 family endonuclease